MPHVVSRRRALGLSGAAALSVMVAACSGNNGRDTGDATTVGGKPVLAQWYHEYGEKGAEAAVKRYVAAYKPAEVLVRWVSGDYDQKAAAALVTGSGPDVFEYANGPTIDMITGRQVVPVTDLLGAARSDFNASLLERMTYQGKLYGIPQVVDMQMFVYRKSLLEKAGVEPPTTFDALIAAAGKLTRGKVKGLFLGNDGGAETMGGPVLWSSGHDYLTAQDEPDFNNADVIKALKKLHELFRSGHLLLGAPADWSDPGAIIDGLAAIQWTGLWALPQLQKAFGDDIGVLPFPAIGSGMPSVPVGAYASCVSARARDIDAAKALVKWLWVDQTADQLDFAQSYGFHVPSRKSLITKATDLRKGEAARAVAMLQKYGHPQSPLLWTPASAASFNDAVGKIIRSGADPSSTLSGVQGTVTSELKRFSDS